MRKSKLILVDFSCVPPSSLFLSRNTRYRCRKRRVKCTVFEEGAPCSSCKSLSLRLTFPSLLIQLLLVTGRNRDASCIVGVDEYPPQTSEQTIIFQPILPPPRVPCSSPIPFASSPSSLNLASLVKALKEPTYASSLFSKFMY